MNISSRLNKVIEWLQQEYVGIRTGQATPALLDIVKVESYGSKMPLNQVGSVGIEDARTLRITPWDAGNVKAIETAIKDANLGVSIATDSAGLRVVFPELTSERRVQLLKLAKQKLEDARVSVRGVREDVIREIEQQEKSGEISKDELFQKKEEIQKEIESTNKKLEDLYKNKETEINK